MMMQRFLLSVLLSVSVLSGYADDNTLQPTQPTQPTVDMKGISTKNFPIIDGSDSTTPLRDILMCKLLGFKYKWVRSFMVQYGGPYGIEPQYTCPQEEWSHLELDCLLNSNTHGSFINLLDGRVEVIFTARSMSRDEVEYAEEKGVELIEKPIAKDALAFLVNPANTVEDLSTEQIQGIYTGEITNWSEVGGVDMDITPYVRNRNSGSQEKFETVVMAGLPIKEFPEMQIGTGMMAPYYQLERDKSGIAYSPFYYYGVMVANGLTKAIGVDGIPMTKENVRNNIYPYVTDVYAAVRSDIDKSSMAYRLFEYITTEAGQAIVAESGYVTLSEFASIEEVIEDNTDTPYYDLQGRPVAHPTRGIYIKEGKKVVIK